MRNKICILFQSINNNNNNKIPQIIHLILKTTNGQPRMAFPKKSFVQRQPSPVLVRHVFTSNQGIPVSMAVLPTGGSSGVQIQHPTAYQNVVNNDGTSGTAINQSGQYILVQRAGVIASDNHSAPRASSAPPAQNQV